MLRAAAHAAYELRRAGDGSARLEGFFPYGRKATLAPGRREMFGPNALEPRDDVLLLSQHEFAKPLASLGAGTLELRSHDNGLEMRAAITPTVAATQAAADALALVEAGLATGLSPGFRVLDGGDEVRRDGEGLLRVVKRAELLELSIVTRPAYPEASVEARCWTINLTDCGSPTRARRRWRA
jgi:hypothetical protein